MSTEKAEFIWGAEAIGKAIGKSARQVHYMLDAGLLPARKVGRQWVISRERLLAYLDGEVAA